MLRAYAVLVLLGLGCRPAPPAPAAPPATVDPTGVPRRTMTKEDIRAVVRASLPEVKRCYNEGLARDPDLEGRVKYQFTITPEGRVHAVSLVSSELPGWASSVEDCIGVVLSALTFPEPPVGGDIDVTYPFVLQPGASEGSPGTVVLAGAHPAAPKWVAAEQQPPRTAVVEVRDEHGRALPGVMVMLIVEGLRGRTELTVTTDAQGIAVFADLPLSGTMVAVAEGVRSDVARRRAKAMRVSLQLPARTPIPEPSGASPNATDRPGVEPTGAPRGTMEKEDIRRVVRSSIPEVKRCYNDGLARDPNLTGSVKYRFTIASDGTVTAVSLLSSDLPGWASSVEDCIGAVVSALTFPEPPTGGNVVVTYPFVLVPEQPRWHPVAGQPPHNAVVAVHDDRDKPVEGAVVTLVYETPLRRQKATAVTDARGVASFSGLPAVGTVYALAEGVVSETAALQRSAIGVTLRISTPAAP